MLLKAHKDSISPHHKAFKPFQNSLFFQPIVFFLLPIVFTYPEHLSTDTLETSYLYRHQKDHPLQSLAHKCLDIRRVLR